MRAFLAILLLLIALPAAGHSYRTQGVMVGHVWAAPTRGSDTEVYVPLLNTAPAADQLVSIIAPTAKLAELVDGSSRQSARSSYRPTARSCSSRAASASD